MSSRQRENEQRLARKMQQSWLYLVLVIVNIIWDSCGAKKHQNPSKSIPFLGYKKNIASSSKKASSNVSSEMYV